MFRLLCVDECLSLSYTLVANLITCASVVVDSVALLLSAVGVTVDVTFGMIVAVDIPAVLVLTTLCARAAAERERLSNWKQCCMI